MTIAITKKNIAIVLGAMTVAMGFLEAMVFRAGWHIAHAAVNTGCACAAGRVVGPGGWAILGFSALFATGLVFGLARLLRALFKTRKLLRPLKNAPVTSDGVVVFQGGRCEAFTFGMLKPRIAICAHCLCELPQAELTAMLNHEAHHVAARDPLWFLLVDTLSGAFFFVPLVRQFAQWFRSAAEIDADADVSNRKALGEVLLRVAEGMPSRAPFVLAISPFASQIEERIERLVNPGWKLTRKVHGVRLIVSAAIMLGALGIASSHAPAREPLLQCASRTQSSPCRRAFDGSEGSYYNGVLYSL